MRLGLFPGNSEKYDRLCGCFFKVVEERVQSESGMLIWEFGFGWVQVWWCIGVGVFHRQRRTKGDGLNFEEVVQL